MLLLFFFYLIKSFSPFLSKIADFSGFVVCLPSHHIIRENGDSHRSPPLHDPERKLCGSVGPAARSRMWPAHRAAHEQARTVQETDGETGFSTRGTEAGTSLTEQEVLHEGKTGGWQEQS